jgi:predicted nucleotide-binding protein
LSYVIYKDDLEALLRDLRAEGSRSSLNIDNKSEPFAGLEYEETLDGIVEDLLDFVNSEDNPSLAYKLTQFGPRNLEYDYLPIGPSELEVRAMRVYRALRTYTEGERLIQDGGGAQISSDSQSAKIKNNISNKVFVVHGHDDAVLHHVCRLLKDLSLEPIVLREMPNSGRTIIEKFEEYSDVGFAVVLMTADDMGAALEHAQSGAYAPRARQNVIMELGYFTAQLTRSRVAVLTEKSVEVPSDILGVVYTELDKSAAWRTLLGKELKAAGYNVDLNKL